MIQFVFVFNVYTTLDPSLMPWVDQHCWRCSLMSRLCSVVTGIMLKLLKHSIHWMYWFETNVVHVFFFCLFVFFFFLLFLAEFWDNYINPRAHVQPTVLMECVWYSCHVKCLAKSWHWKIFGCSYMCIDVNLPVWNFSHFICNCHYIFVSVKPCH